MAAGPDFAVAVYSGYLKSKDKDELATAIRIPSGTPPIFLAHGGDDTISPPQNSALMYLALKQAGVSDAVINAMLKTAQMPPNQTINVYQTPYGYPYWGPGPYWWGGPYRYYYRPVPAPAPKPSPSPAPHPQPPSSPPSPPPHRHQNDGP